MIRLEQGIEVRQNHISKHFCLTDLNRLLPEKHVSGWLRLKQTRELVTAVSNRYGIPEKEILPDRKLRDEVWAHPVLFLDFVMWLSPEFKVKALEWLSDHLCQWRDQAGESHKRMCQALDEVLSPRDGKTYAYETWMVQDLAGLKSGHRNLATEEQLSLLERLQTANARLIRKGVKDITLRRRELIKFKDLLGYP